MDTRQQKNVPAAQIFSDRLASLRGNRSKRSFCKEIGVNSPQTYQHYENGRVPDADTLYMIADKCGVTVDWLLGRDDYPAPVNLPDRPVRKVEKGQLWRTPAPKLEKGQPWRTPAPKLEKGQDGCCYPERCDLEGELSHVRERLAGMEDELGYMRSQLDTVVGLLGAALGDPLSKGKQERKAG